MVRPIFLAALLLQAAGCGTSSNDVPRVDLLIHAHRVIVGNGDVIGNTWVSVVDTRIDRIAPIPPNARADRVLELKPDDTLMPGLIETHAHLLAAPDFTKDSDEAMAAFLEYTLPGILEDYLAAGFTTVVDNGDPWPDIRQVRDEVARQERRGPRILTLGPILTGIDGHPAGNIYGANSWGRERGTRELDDPVEARRVVDHLADEGVDGIKVAYDGNPQPRMLREVLQAIVQEAGQRGLPVYVHAGTAEEAVDAVEAGAARLVHVPPESPLAGTDLVKLLLENGIGVATTIGASGPEGHFTVDTGSADPTFGTLRANLSLLNEAGVLLAYGTDNTNVFPARRVLEVELRELENAGLSRGKILSMLTGDASRYLFLKGEIGTVEVGNRADLLVVDGDPLENLAVLGNVRAVIGKGEFLFGEAKDPQKGR